MATRDIKRKVQKLRKKYAEGLVSEEYMRTGIPQHITERVEGAKDEISHLLKEDEKNTRQAIKALMKRKRKGRKLKEEDNLIFI